MPYSAEHKKRSRLRILHSAAQRFLTQGYERTGIDQVMADAGMTRGAFYAHFSGKSELYARAMGYAATRGRFHAFSREVESSLPALLENYLSLDHVSAETTPCPMAFLVTDVVSREPGVRHAYTRVYERMVKQLARRMEGGGEHDSQAMAVTALMIGGVALARAVDDAPLSERILAACRDAAARLAEEVDLDTRG